MTSLTRRGLLAGLAGTTASLAGCTTALPGWRRPADPDRTLYVGAFHWGFVVLDDDGTRHESLTLPRETGVRVVAFNLEAESAIDALPTRVRSALPDHETLEAANDDAIPSPPDGTLDEKRAEANERYPDHSVTLAATTGYGGMMGRHGHMLFHPLSLAHDAPGPVETYFRTADADEYSLECLTYCGYGHPYMDLEDAVVVR